MGAKVVGRSHRLRLAEIRCGSDSHRLAESLALGPGPRFVPVQRF